MPPSTLLQMLIRLQNDLNAMTVCCIESNSRITDMIALYSNSVAPYDVIRDRCVKWGTSLDALANALERFQADADKLGEYFDAQR